LSFLESRQEVTVNWIVFSSDPQRAREARDCADKFLRHARSSNVAINNFRDGFFPFIGAEIKEYFERLKQEISPDLIFTHYRNDLHQDHRLISELTRNTFRSHLILEYEIPKYDGDLGAPNLFVPLDEPICRRKSEYILSSFKSQSDKPWFREDTFFSLLRLRGVESNSPGKCAEAFYCRKMVLGLK